MNREAFGAQTDSFLRMGLTDASGYDPRPSHVPL